MSDNEGGDTRRRTRFSHSEFVASGPGPVDVARAILGWVIVLSPLVVYTNAVLGSPLHQNGVRTILLASCGVGTVFVVLGYWSLDRLWTYALVLLATAIGIASIGAVVVTVTGIEIAGNDPLPLALVWAYAYSITFLLMKRFEGHS